MAEECVMTMALEMTRDQRAELIFEAKVMFIMYEYGSLKNGENGENTWCGHENPGV